MNCSSWSIVTTIIPRLIITYWTSEPKIYNLNHHSHHRRQDRIDHRERRSAGARRCSPSMTHRLWWCFRGSAIIHPSIYRILLTFPSHPHSYLVPTMEWWWCQTGSACGTLLRTTASTSGDTYLFIQLTFRYFFHIPLHSYTTLVLRIALWEEEVMISSGRLVPAASTIVIWWRELTVSDTSSQLVSKCSSGCNVRKKKTFILRMCSTSMIDLDKRW